MANITISKLQPTGSELFSDFESFMSDLIDDEFGVIKGGRRFFTEKPFTAYPSEGYICTNCILDPFTALDKLLPP